MSDPEETRPTRVVDGKRLRGVIRGGQPSANLRLSKIRLGFEANERETTADTPLRRRHEERFEGAASFQDLCWLESAVEDGEEEKRRENVLVLLNDLRLEKAEEEQFWLEQGEIK